MLSASNLLTHGFLHCFPASQTVQFGTFVIVHVKYKTISLWKVLFRIPSYPSSVSIKNVAGRLKTRPALIDWATNRLYSMANCSKILTWAQPKGQFLVYLPLGDLHDTNSRIFASLYLRVRNSFQCPSVHMVGGSLKEYAYIILIQSSTHELMTNKNVYNCNKIFRRKTKDRRGSPMY